MGMRFTGPNSVTIRERGLEDMIDVCKKITGRMMPEITAQWDALWEVSAAEVKARISSPAAPHTPATYMPTGSLQGSMTVEVTNPSPTSWQGVMDVGGPSEGGVPTPQPLGGVQQPKNPVDYAIYEWARGGEHDMYAELPVTLIPAMEQVLIDFFETVTAGE